MPKKRRKQLSFSDVVQMQLYREQLEFASRDLELKRAKLLLKKEERHERLQKQVHERRYDRAHMV